jgi:hypothetical protein
MTEITLQQITEIYSWLTMSIIMIFVASIAVFYQRKFGVKTRYYLYGVPVVVLFASALHVFSYETVLAESTELLGSITSFLASYYLYRTMMGGKK